MHASKRLSLRPSCRILTCGGRKRALLLANPYPVLLYLPRVSLSLPRQPLLAAHRVGRLRLPLPTGEPCRHPRILRGRRERRRHRVAGLPSAGGGDLRLPDGNVLRPANE